MPAAAKTPWPPFVAIASAKSPMTIASAGGGFERRKITTSLMMARSCPVGSRIDDHGPAFFSEQTACLVLLISITSLGFATRPRPRTQAACQDRDVVKQLASMGILESAAAGPPPKPLIFAEQICICSRRARLALSAAESGSADGF